MPVSGPQYHLVGWHKGQRYVLSQDDNENVLKGLKRVEEARGYYENLEVLDYHEWAEDQESRAGSDQPLEAYPGANESDVEVASAPAPKRSRKSKDEEPSSGGSL